MSAAGKASCQRRNPLKIEVGGHEDLELARRNWLRRKKVDPALNASLKSTWARPINSAGHKKYYGS